MIALGVLVVGISSVLTAGSRGAAQDAHSKNVASFMQRFGGRTRKGPAGRVADAKLAFGSTVKQAKKTAKRIIKQNSGESVEDFIKRMETALESREDEYENVAEELIKAKEGLARELEERAEELKGEADDLEDGVEEMKEDDEETKR